MTVEETRRTTQARRTLTALAVVAAFTIAGSAGSPVRAQQPGIIWQFETVAPAQLPTPTCIYGMRLTGFEYGPDGRPVVGWTEHNDCSNARPGDAPPEIYWARKDGGAWTVKGFATAGQYNGGARD